MAADQKICSLYCCHVLGSGLCVTHPATDFVSMDSMASSKRRNTDYFSRLLENAQKWDMQLTIENMCDYTIAPKKKYCARPEEIVDFLDDFADDRMGACWDFEHADIMQIDQRQALRYLGRHLKATHVSDTHSKTDHHLMHVMPLFGTVDWATVMRTLRELDYQGDFCLEAHNFANRLPDALLPTALKLSYEIGTYLMSLT